MGGYFFLLLVISITKEISAIRNIQKVINSTHVMYSISITSFLTKGRNRLDRYSCPTFNYNVFRHIFQVSNLNFTKNNRYLLKQRLFSYWFYANYNIFSIAANRTQTHRISAAV